MRCRYHTDSGNDAGAAKVVLSQEDEKRNRRILEDAGGGKGQRYVVCPCFWAFQSGDSLEAQFLGLLQRSLLICHIAIRLHIWMRCLGIVLNWTAIKCRSMQRNPTPVDCFGMYQ